MIKSAGSLGLAIFFHSLPLKISFRENFLTCRATGGILGEKPMWMEDGERTTVENTKRLYPGLYASGMAANNVQGGFRMGPIFGGMFKSGRKIAKIILEDLKA